MFGMIANVVIGLMQQLGLRGTAGTATAPSMFFASEPTTGFFIVSAGTIGVATLGGDHIRFHGSVGIQTDLGLIFYASGYAAGVGLSQGGAAGVLALTDGSTGGGSIQFTEISDPAAPAANKARLYCKDNGSGKSLLVVRFPTGAVQTIATEP